MNKQRIENSDYAEIVALEPKYEWITRKKTNQQATANHTVKFVKRKRVEFFNEEWMTGKEIKMTRKEAIQKACGVTSNVNRYDIINILEALGLIKFDEEKSVVDEAKQYVRNYTLYDRQELAGVIDMLIRHIEK